MNKNRMKVHPSSSAVSLSSVALVAPVDSGRAWLSVLGSFFVHFVALGMVYSYGVFLPHIEDEFGINRATSAWVGSANVGVMLIVSAVMGRVVWMPKVGARPVAVGGGVLIFAGVWATSYSTQVWHMFAAYSVVSGVGLSCSFIPAVSSVQTWFVKKRGLATGLAVAGSGAGNFVFPIVLTSIIEASDWRVAMRVMAVFVGAVIIIFGWTTITLRARVVELHRQESARTLMLIEKNAELDRDDEHKMDGGEARSSFNDVQDFPSGSAVGSNNGSRPPHQMVVLRGGELEQELHVRQHQQRALVAQHAHYTPAGRTESALASINTERIGGAARASIELHAGTNSIASDAPTTPIIREQTKEPLRPKLGQQLEEEKPDDMVDDEESNADKQQRQRQQQQPMTLSEILHSRPFRLLLLANFMGSFGYGTPFFHIVPFAKQQGVSEADASIVLSMFGIASLVGRISLGRAADDLGRLRVLRWSVAIMGVVSILWPFVALDLSLMVVYALVYGFNAGAFVSLPPAIATDYFGTSHISTLVGVLFAMNGVPSSSGPAIAGWLYDETDSYVGAGMMTGVSLLCAVAVWSMMPHVDAYASRNHALQH
eukprot:TRINITY_DN65761_c3_g1_i1.p2 TRINITY_DN65761_c3_g1~~TRINITY_DN65761_c3_g1_i1.p2  ORF type:complete len:599 (-),score=285.23 TRINITY_DN65761_c3_g1_i1:612-2408(-)